MNLMRCLLLTVIVVPGCALFGRDDDYGDYSYVPESPYYEPQTPKRGPNQPDFGKGARADVAPPPISGGTLHVTKDGRTAIASDPDRDVIYVVDLERAVVRTIALETDDEPGRVAVDDEGRAHVALRRGGAVVSIDLATAAILGRRDVCPAPRGIAWSKARRELLVACATGELAIVPADPSGAVEILTTLERDLRDVVVVGDRVFVTTFRTANLIEVARATGERITTRAPQGMPDGVPMIAWRMVAAPEGDLDQEPVVVHEEGTESPLPSAGAAYYSARDCSTSSFRNVITSALSRFGSAGHTYLLPPEAVLPVDVAFDGSRYAVVAAGNGHTPDRARVLLFSDRNLVPASSYASSSGIRDCVDHFVPVGRAGEPIAVALRSGGVVVQMREPAQLLLSPSGEVITLSDVTRADTGHAVFHSDAGGGAACASCHAEGADDGRVWSVDEVGQRRTPSLLGTLKGTAPFHWDGSVANIHTLAGEVFSTKMSGPELSTFEKDTLEGWLFALRAPKAPAIRDAAAGERGRALFEGAAGCTECHQGPQLTRSGRFDVGTGGSFEVPPLVGAAVRAPYLHDGCGKTFGKIFDCGTRHGSFRALDEAQRADLVTFLESL
jgi:hypothetical protein